MHCPRRGIRHCLFVVFFFFSPARLDRYNLCSGITCTLPVYSPAVCLLFLLFWPVHDRSITVSIQYLFACSSDPLSFLPLRSLSRQFKPESHSFSASSSSSLNLSLQPHLIIFSSLLFFSFLSHFHPIRCRRRPSTSTSSSPCLFLFPLFFF